MDPQAFYRPHPDQILFHKSPAAIRAVMGGNRVGKTHMGANEVIWIARGIHPYIQAPIPNRGRIGVTDFKVHKNVIWPKLEAWLPWEEVAEIQKGMAGVIQGVRLKNGSFFDIMSYEQLPMKWESVELDYAWFDEPPPYEIWRATRARIIDRDGRIWFTLTPLEEPWIHEEIWEQCGKNPRYWGIVSDMRNNPYLSRKAVQEFIKEVSKEDYEARVRGQFRHLTGRVLKDFTDQYPYVMSEEQADIKPFWPRLFVLDPHEKTPWACEWYALDEENDTVYRYDEYRHDPAEGIEVFGRVVRNMELRHNARVPDHMRVGDTYGNRPTYSKGGPSLYDQIHNITGITIRACSKEDLDKRLWDLIYRYKINPATRIPRIITLEHCLAARKEISQLVWDKHRTKAGQWQADKQTPVKKNDHSISCDLYMGAEWPASIRCTDPLYLFNRDPQILEESTDMADFDGRPVDILQIEALAARARARKKRGKGVRNVFR